MDSGRPVVAQRIRLRLADRRADSFSSPVTLARVFASASFRNQTFNHRWKNGLAESHELSGSKAGSGPCRLSPAIKFASQVSRSGILS